MTEHNISEIINKVIDKEIIENFARETGFIQRNRKITAVDFLFILVFRTSKALPVSLRNIASFIKCSVSRIAVHQKFNEKASLFLWKCLQYGLLQQVQDRKLETSLLDNFANIKIIDSSSWNISPELETVFPGSGGNASPASSKVQLIYEYKTSSIYFTELTEGTYPDQKYSKKIINKIYKNDLYIFDLGYCVFDLLKKIDEKDAFFISRFNIIANLWFKIEDEFKDFNLENYLQNQNGYSLEFDVFIKKNNEFIKIRLIAFRVPEDTANLRRSRLKTNAKKKGRTPSKKSLSLCDWSLFITNCNENLVPGEMIRSLYRVRWSIELIFKNWKSILNIHKNNAKTNEHRLRCELYAKLFFAVIIHNMYQYLNCHLWNTKRKEISFWCFWRYITDRAQLLHETIKISVEKFICLLKLYIPDIIQNCKKNKQPSRKTTIELIENMIGDESPAKINENLLLSFCMQNA